MGENAMEKDEVRERDKDLPEVFNRVVDYLRPLLKNLEEIMQNAAQRDEKRGRKIFFLNDPY